MARKAISPWFIFRRVNNSIQDGGSEVDLELDFQIGQGQAVEVASTELSVAEFNVAGSPGVSDVRLMMSLHRRTGTLTDEVTPALTSVFSQSEVLHNKTIGWGGTLGADGSRAAYAEIDLGPTTIEWRRILDAPLLIAANLTFRVTITAAITGAVTFNGAYAKVVYRYVTVTAGDLVSAFIARQ